MAWDDKPPAAKELTTAWDAAPPDDVSTARKIYNNANADANNMVAGLGATAQKLAGMPAEASETIKQLLDGGAFADTPAGEDLQAANDMAYDAIPHKGEKGWEPGGILKRAGDIITHPVDSFVEHPLNTALDVASVADPLLKAGKTALAAGEAGAAGAVRTGMGRKLVSAALGPPEQSLKDLVENPGRVLGAKAPAGLAEDMGKTMTGLSKTISKEDSVAWKTLKTSHDPLDGALPKADIADIINKAKLDPQITGGGTFGPAGKKAVAVLDGLIDDLDNVGYKTGGKVKSVMGAPSSLRNKDFISESQLKQLIKAADDNIDWENQAATPLNNALESVREALDSKLKAQNAAYKLAMEPVAEKTGLFKKLKRAFNFTNETGEGIVPTDATPGKIERAPGENKIATHDILEDLKKNTGDDYMDKADAYNTSKDFKGGRTQGSRRVVWAGGLGAGVGYGLGSLVGEPAAGATVGGMAGTSLGGFIDKEGGRMAGDIVSRLAQTDPTKLGRYGRQLAASATKGAGVVGVNHFILMNTDPEYRTMIKGLQDKNGQE